MHLTMCEYDIHTHVLHLLYELGRWGWSEQAVSSLTTVELLVFE